MLTLLGVVGFTFVDDAALLLVGHACADWTIPLLPIITNALANIIAIPAIRNVLFIKKIIAMTLYKGFDYNSYYFYSFIAIEDPNIPTADKQQLRREAQYKHLINELNEIF